MAETVPGGAYLRGETWVNANGEPLEKGVQAEAEKLQKERAAELEQQETRLIELTAQRDPVARALLQQQAVQAAQRQAPKADK
jgi:hypothetical protein